MTETAGGEGEWLRGTEGGGGRGTRADSRPVLLLREHRTHLRDGRHRPRVLFAVLRAAIRAVVALLFPAMGKQGTMGS